MHDVFSGICTSVPTKTLSGTGPSGRAVDHARYSSWRHGCSPSGAFSGCPRSLRGVHVAGLRVNRTHFPHCAIDWSFSSRAFIVLVKVLSIRLVVQNVQLIESRVSGPLVNYIRDHDSRYVQLILSTAAGRQERKFVCRDAHIASSAKHSTLSVALWICCYTFEYLSYGAVLHCWLWVQTVPHRNTPCKESGCSSCR